MSKRAIIGTPSRLSLLSSIHTLSASVNYPVVNLSDKVRITNPWRSTTAGADWVYYTFPTTLVPVQLVALIGHNLTAGATIRLRLYNSTTYDNTFSQPAVYDSGTIAAWPEGSAPVAGYRSIRPILIQDPVLCGSLSLDIVPNNGVSVEVGALEVSGAWDLGGVSPGRSRGYDGRTQAQILAGGADNVPDFWLPRVWRGGIDTISAAISESTFQDFVQAQDVVQPFVFSDDMANPIAWPRSCMLVRNQKINPAVGATYRRDKLTFSFIEHSR